MNRSTSVARMDMHRREILQDVLIRSPLRFSAPRVPLSDAADDAGLGLVAVGGAVPAQHVDLLAEQHVVDVDVAGQRGRDHGARTARRSHPDTDGDPEEEGRRRRRGPQEGRAAAAGGPAQKGQGVALLPPRPGMHAGRLLKERRQAGEAEEERQAPAG